ncbi:DUF6191 domain-containing protein [Actinocorallia sp. API 0066]|uniref:DUF6191 domain-containing protein n=1 Tax=Actinocorallia sp. API 0066 TaxID=2896846 RepID=UPI001E4014F3|nr:DUF6191 domain-containing protein [Actinocorallia sp. API 0066]MCD0451707.1 DUF6191 domain-containing protein [Actinocorallia sp. API 0066]
MAVVLFLTVPGLVLLLVVLAAVDRLGLAAHRRLRLPWRTEEQGRAVSAAGIDELQALFHATKRYELDQRRTSLMLRDEEGDGAPPRTRIDLDGGTAVIRPDHR